MLRKRSNSALISGSIYLLALIHIMQAINVSPESGAGKKRPNIVFIFADDMGWRDIGYQDSDIYTPHLDELAASGVKLQNYYCHFTCSPTRSSLMTGRYMIHMGTQSLNFRHCQVNGLPLEYPTIADILKKAGYSTHGLGKWHLGFSRKEYTPLYRGFDTFYGILPAYADHFTYQGCDATFTNLTITEPPTDVGMCGYSLVDGIFPDYSVNGTFSTFSYTARAVDIIRNEAHSEKPFFMILSYQTPHSPVEAPDNYDIYNNIVNEDRKKYAGMVRTLDEGVANVTQALKDAGLWDNTVLIFSSDNGAEVTQGGSNWPLRGNKDTYWDGAIRTLGFVTSPLLDDKVKGKVINELIHVTDWFPTLADIAGAEFDDSLGLDGVSQWETLKDGAPSPRTEFLVNIDRLYTLSGYRLYNDTFDTRIRAAIRVGDYKLLTGNPGDSSWYQIQGEENYEAKPLDAEIDYTHGTGKNVWLYNIPNDPNELIDLSYSMPEKVRELLDRLDAYDKSSLPPMEGIYDPNCDPSLNGGYWHPWLE